MDSDLLNFLNLFRAFRIHGFFVVVFELLLIGLFVYAVVRLLRGTRGLRMLKGVGLALLVLYLIVRLVAKEYGLQRVEFLYGRLLLLISFAMVVVFQPELRRALMRLGETRLFRRLSRQLNQDVEALVESAIFLSRRKIGAVIAIERDVNLGAIAETGTSIDAELSAAMLNTIFWPNSPLHDLGVIVSHGRIVSAGVQFPLAESGDMDKDLGSRHRAAVGMSQETNALVMVVSEETGDISVADHGHLIRKLSPEALRSILTDLLAGREHRPAPSAAAAPAPPPQTIEVASGARPEISRRS